MARRGIAALRIAVFAAGVAVAGAELTDPVSAEGVTAESGQVSGSVSGPGAQPAPEPAASEPTRPARPADAVEVVVPLPEAPAPVDLAADPAGPPALSAAAAPDPAPLAPLPPEPAAPAGLADAAPAPVAPAASAAEAPASPSPAVASPPATAQSPTPPPAAGQPAPSQTVVVPVPVDPAAPIAARIASLLADPGALVASAKEQEALLAFYGARSHAPLFVGPQGLSKSGTSIQARFAAAGADGLEPGDYARVKLSAGADTEALARAELKLAASALLYARHAQAGRFDPSVRISGMVTPTRTFPDPLAVLFGLAQAADAGAALAAYQPPHPGYRVLRAKLAEARQAPSTPPVRIPAGPTLRPGEVDARVPTLRARLGRTGGHTSRIYDGDLAEAVRGFQVANGLEADGVIGASTLDALNRWSDSGDRSADIIANMERWRWLPRDLGTRHVMVNIPEFTVRVYDDGLDVFDTRVVVGKPESPTPLLTKDMTYVVVNPYWNIPPTIARKEMLPNLQRDPYFLTRQGMEIVRNGRVVDPATVNWTAGLGGYSFRQPPGERNALGRIKFMFPNDHSVYLHDTPSRRLFANDRRAYSHGCIRVQDPLAFGEVVFNLGMDGGWSEARIEKMLGGAERYITLKQKIPVHLVYFTTFVDEQGRLRSREDIYGINEKVKAILGLGTPSPLAAGRSTTSAR